MKFKEVKEKAVAELENLEQNLRKEFAELSLKARMGQLVNTARPGNVRRDIARILTAKRSKGQ